MPRYSLRTLMIITAMGGPLLAALYLRPLAVMAALLAAPTILAVLVAGIMTPILAALALVQFARRFRMK